MVQRAGACKKDRDFCSNPQEEWHVLRLAYHGWFELVVAHSEFKTSLSWDCTRVVQFFQCMFESRV